MYSACKLAVGLFAIFHICIETPAAAAKLPKALTLQCSGNSKIVQFFPVRDKAPRWSDGVFDITVHLRDGLLMNVSNNELLGKDCVMVEGEIGCGFEQSRRVERLNILEHTQGAVVISRDSGTIRMVHSTRSSADGRGGAVERIERNGICRTMPTPRPLF